MSIGVCRVSRHSQPPPCSPSHSSEATTAAGGTPRPPPRHDDCATVGRTVQCRACSSRPSAPRGIGCGNAISTVGVPWPNVIDPTLPGRHTPVGAADHRAWAPGSSRHSHNDPTSPTRCPEESFVLDRFPDGVREKFGTLSRARLSAARRPGRARSNAGAPSRMDLPPFVPLRSTSDGRKCDATIEA